MLRDNARKNFLEQDYNCAETMLRLINEQYGLGLKNSDFKLISGFGAGCGYGRICGTLAGAMAALGVMTVEERAHATPGFKELCGEYCERFTHALGSTECADLRPKYFQEGIRCALAVEEAADCFEAFVSEKGLR